MIQWTLVALILAAAILAIIRRCRRKSPPCDSACSACPLSPTCDKVKR